MISLHKYCTTTYRRVGRKSLASSYFTSLQHQNGRTMANGASPESTSSKPTDVEDDWFNTKTQGDIDERIVPKPVSYLPDHLPQTRRRQRQKPWWKFRYFVDIHTLPVENEEYSKEPEYPEIYDRSSEGVKLKVRKEWYAAIRRLPTAQQKIFEITKHYAHLTYLMEPVQKQYNQLPLQQYITRTHLIKGLPDQFNSNGTVDENLKSLVLKSVENRLFQTKSKKPSFEFKRSEVPLMGMPDGENFAQTSKEEDILVDIIQLIRGSLTQTSDVQIDYNPYVASSWWVNDYTIPFKKKKWFKNDTIEQLFTYRSTHALHLRAKHPLPQVRNFF